MVVDKLSEYSCFLPLKHLFSTSLEIGILIKEIIKILGILKSIILDQEKLFIRNS